MIAKKKTKIKEEEFFQPITRLFTFKRYLIRREVPFNGKTVDVLLMDKESNRLIAIELKVHKWKKALRQAAVYQLCANQVYIALWHKHINETNKKLIANYGIGIIEVRKIGKNLKSEIILSPKQQGLLNRQYAKLLRVYFQSKK